ncbi:NUDIX hydrolase [Salipiger sp. H15]|uniref:NUDIX hydrolase n=1 Tax=Alloyangia sp. H15 TaxID=3029062 RepID=A0AAU8AIZ2_9RHOB
MTSLGEQIAALPLQWDKTGKLRVLMVTSRDTGRWVMPKGWEMDGKKPWAAAEIEALEEAGACGHVGKAEIGAYHYGKRRADGTELRCRVRVYPMIVERLQRDWKERKERKRKWFSPRDAARRVDEPELAALLLTLCDAPHELPLISALLG